MRDSMNYLVDPQTLIFNSHRVSGYSELVKNIPQWELLQIAQEVAEEWTEDWPEDQGFGSSDRTYMIKQYIDQVCWSFASGKFMTQFNPSLSVVEYSEADHHERVQRMESGI